MSITVTRTPRGFPDWLMIAVGGIVLALDQTSKALVTSEVAARPPGTTVEVLGSFLRVLYTTNTGAAFGLFTNGVSVLAVVSALAVPLLLYIRTRLPVGYTTWLVRLTFGLLLGGDLGNLVDRVRLGYVVDFVDMGIGGLRWFPYNVADASFVVGVVILAVYVFLVPEEPAESASGPRPAPDGSTSR